MEPVSATILRIIIAAIGVVILVGIYFFGRPRRPGQGRRVVLRTEKDERVEPVLGDPQEEHPGEGGSVSPQQGELDVALQRELDRLGAAVVAGRRGATVSEPLAPPEPAVGQRPHEFPVDRIVTLFVVAHEGDVFRGSDIVVAAEKAGLRFGAMHIFHRLVDGRPDAGPVFSMANMIKPGYFNMARIAELTTPGVTFFITLPGPLAALDAWEAMLPAAQRIAELLGGELLDEDRNALGRQRVAGLREELRAWDRQHEGPLIGAPPPRR
ncbi:MAG TPA: cell division protein ZipA [Rhodanobacteraceae bacterium]|jgi:cell division protein ZipA|nr:cell division protein ZipA [Rhodanobacteraceae bacterium]